MRTTVLLLAFLALNLSPLSLRAADSLKVMTYNLRYASTNKPNAWPDRLPIMVDCLQKSDPDLFGTQEGVYYQLNELERALKSYRWIGTGRDGGSRGEFASNRSNTIISGCPIPPKSSAPPPGATPTAAWSPGFASATANPAPNSIS